jgi:hypothetical protein
LGHRLLSARNNRLQPAPPQPPSSNASTPSVTGSFTKRTLYAVSRVLITRTDNSNPTFNFSEVIGSDAAVGLSTLWYPKQYQTWTKVGQKWLTSDLIDGFNFWWKEWWPTANKYVFHTH